MIPKIIHRIWVGGPEPEWLQEFGKTWEQPGWEVIHHNGPPYLLQNQEIYDKAERHAPNYEGQLRSDILRLELLYLYGGVYVDCDFELLTTIDDLLDVSCFFAWEVQDVWINNAIMGAVPGHPFIKHLIHALPTSVRLNKGYKPNRMTGPRFVTKQYRGWEHRVTVYDQSMFYPYAWNEIDNPPTDYGQARAVHHFANKRRERNIPYVAPGAERAHS